MILGLETSSLGFFKEIQLKLWGLQFEFEFEFELELELEFEFEFDFGFESKPNHLVQDPTPQKIENSSTCMHSAAKLS